MNRLGRGRRCRVGAKSSLKTSLIDDTLKNEIQVHEQIQRIHRKGGKCTAVQDVTLHVSKDHNQSRISLDKRDIHIEIHYQQRYHI